MVRSRPTILLLLLVLLLAAASPTLARAEDEPAAGKQEPAAEQPDIFRPRLDLTIWTIIVFLVLLWVLKKLAWQPMLEGLQGRENRIREALAEAQRASDEAKKLQARLQAEMDKAGEKVRGIMDDARKAAQQTTDEMIAKARAEIQTERERLRREIDTARDQALMDLYNRSVQLATVISSKVIRRQLTLDDQRLLVDEALSDLEQFHR